jgi:hypothetical protein
MLQQHEPTDQRIAPRVQMGPSFDEKLFFTKTLTAKFMDVGNGLARLFHSRVPKDYPKQPAYRAETFGALMTGERFDTTHQGIAFGWNGELLDGEARLRAIIATGMTVQVMVTFGLNPAVARSIDATRGRSSAVVARAMRGVKSHVTETIGAAKLWLRYEAALNDGRLLPPAHVSVQAPADFAKNTPLFLTAVGQVLFEKQTWAHLYNRSAVLCLAYHALTQGHPVPLVLEFLRSLTGNAEQPQTLLGNALRDAREHAKQVPAHHQLMALIRVYSAWVNREQLDEATNLLAMPTSTAGADVYFPRVPRHSDTHRTAFEKPLPG